ncbi:hypothetical protein [Chitinophaga sp.]|uniref:hypothetical protein n=1 Tax=Chitinophaga sp. TaxID=1869181 RepID=UPI00261F8B55|nr:hypothetical protein [uncultured Chitinophaga sp.]
MPHPLPFFVIPQEQNNRWKWRFAASFLGTVSGMLLLYMAEVLEISVGRPMPWLPYLTPACTIISTSFCHDILALLRDYLQERGVNNRKARLDVEVHEASCRQNVSEKQKAFLNNIQMSADRSMVEFHLRKLSNALDQKPDHQYAKRKRRR